VDLHPQVVFGSGRRPTPVEVADLHHAAHDQCFIAASIRTEVRVQGGGA
jgi:organic hydroperoxide reductase OsmC/OhrA